MVKIYALLAIMGLILFGIVLGEDLKAKAEPTVLFDGKSLAGWECREKELSQCWTVAGDETLDPADAKKLVGVGKPVGDKGVIVARLDGVMGTDLVTKAVFKDVVIRLEFMMPKDGNSGIFLMGNYELQICDSFGIADKDFTEGDAGGIPFQKKAKVNASLEPGKWQTYEVHFKAPRFDANGKKTSNATIVKAILNGKLVQENFEYTDTTGGCLTEKEVAEGPLMLQGDHSAAAFGNITITELK